MPAARPRSTATAASAGGSVTGAEGAAAILEGLRPLAVAIDSLAQLEGNPRKGDVDAVAASLARFGQRKPIVVRASDRQIIAGNHTWRAARQLGWTEIAAVLVDDDTATSQAFALADNRTAELGSYDESLLLELIRAVGDVDPSLLGDSGWDAASIADLVDRIEDPAGGLTDPDDVPALRPDPFAAPGDVWILGAHRVTCGDSTSLDDLERLMGGPDVLADMVWTDPPYNVAVDGIAGTIANDDMSDAAFAQFLRDCMSTAYVALRPGGAIYVAHAETERLNFTATFLQAGFKLASCIIWRKSQFTLGRADYQWQHEPILYGWKPGAAHRWFGGRKESTIADLGGSLFEQVDDRSWRVSIGATTLLVTGDNLTVSEIASTVVDVEKPSRNGEHPTMKPVALVDRMLRNSSRGGDIVLDLFGGSGSTLIACEASGRQARLMELDPRFVDVICRRWQQYTGHVPLLESTGEPHDFTQD